VDDAVTSADAIKGTPAWQEIALGILVHPIATMSTLDQWLDGDRVLVNQLTTKAFNTVFLSSILLGLSRVQPDQSVDSILTVLLCLAAIMIIWVVMSGILAVLPSLLKARSVRWDKALALSGWAFLPLIFFAPILCFKLLVGALIFPFAMIPLLWSLILFWFAYKIALGVSNAKLFVLAVVLPPMLFFSFTFWLGAGTIFFINELASAFSR